METVEKKTLREWREDLGLTQQELADLGGTNHRMVSNVERGQAGPRSKAARLCADALGISTDQIVYGAPKPRRPMIGKIDGYAPDAPRMTLREWRDERGLSTVELSGLSGIGATRIVALEKGKDNRGRITRVLGRTKAQLALGLKVAPDRLVLPGDPPVIREEQSALDYARRQLSAKERVLHKAYDFMRDDSNIAFRGDALDRRDALLPEIQRELKGT